MKSVNDRKTVWANSPFDGSYSDAKRQSAEFNKYKSSEKRKWVSEKSDLDTLLGTVKGLSVKLGSLDNSLSRIEEIDAQCHEANIEENDYTVFSVDDLSFELELVKQSVNKKSAF